MQQGKYCFTPAGGATPFASIDPAKNMVNGKMSTSQVLKNKRKPPPSALNASQPVITAFGRTMPRPAPSTNRVNKSMMITQQHENDFRCEFDLPKFVNLRQTMTTRSQKASILSQTAMNRETMASSQAKTSLLPITQNPDQAKRDENFDWF